MALLQTCHLLRLSGLMLFELGMYYILTGRIVRSDRPIVLVG